MVENGALRIIGHPRYPESPGPPSSVAPFLQSLLAKEGHVFWPEDFSILSSEWVQADRLSSSQQITDTYLLALARSHNGKLATFDRKLVATAVTGGANHLHLI